LVRKVNGFNQPAQANQAAGERLLAAIETHAPPKNRAEEAARDLPNERSGGSILNSN
jgi:hypothetical protein